MKHKDDKAKTFTIACTKEEFARFREWIRQKRGVAVWENHALDSAACGDQIFTPVREQNGQEYGAPYADTDPMAARYGCAWRFVRVADIETEEEFDRRVSHEDPETQKTPYEPPENLQGSPPPTPKKKRRKPK